MNNLSPFGLDHQIVNTGYIVFSTTTPVSVQCQGLGPPQTFEPSY